MTILTANGDGATAELVCPAEVIVDAWLSRCKLDIGDVESDVKRG